MIAWNSLHNWVVSANNINAFKKTISIGNIKILYTIFLKPKLK